MPVSRESVLARLPNAPGVYRFLSPKGAPLYVGKAADLRKRVASYFVRRVPPRVRLMLAAADNVEATVTASADEALLLENNLIKSLKPRYNILFRDDKSYPFLRLTAHAFPRVMFHRGDPGKDGAGFFGPFPDSGAVRKSIDIVQRAFQLRTCADAFFQNRARPCLLHQVRRCSAPCVNKISPAEYAADVSRARDFLRGKADSALREMTREMDAASGRREYEAAIVWRDRIRAVAAVRKRALVDDPAEPDADYVGAHCENGAACLNIAMMRGGRSVGERRLFPANVSAGDSAEDVLTAFLSQGYGATTPPKKIALWPPLKPEAVRDANPDLAARVSHSPLGDARKRAQSAAENARLALAMQQSRRAATTKKLAAVAARLQLPAPPARIECFDVSHTMGEATVAARAVFADGLPHPREHRRFNIRSAKSGDDCAAMREVVLRCYKRALAEGTPLPDLILIDGGAGQVKAALESLDALKEAGMPGIPLVGIAKGAERKSGNETLIFPDGETARWDSDDPALLALLAVRDEAHRFAVAGHRRRRDKKRRTSILEEVEGIGPKARRILLERFGGLKGLRSASVSDLRGTEGVGPVLAERIFRALR